VWWQFWSQAREEKKSHGGLALFFDWGKKLGEGATTASLGFGRAPSFFFLVYILKCVGFSLYIFHSTICFSI
jgi:hypothetical protein